MEKESNRGLVIVPYKNRIVGEMYSNHLSEDGNGDILTMRWTQGEYDNVHRNTNKDTYKLTFLDFTKYGGK